MAQRSLNGNELQKDGLTFQMLMYILLYLYSGTKSKFLLFSKKSITVWNIHQSLFFFHHELFPCSWFTPPLFYEFYFPHLFFEHDSLLHNLMDHCDRCCFMTDGLPLILYVAKQTSAGDQSVTRNGEKHLKLWSEYERLYICYLNKGTSSLCTFFDPRK